MGASSDDAKRIVGSQWAWAGIDGFEFGPHGKLRTPWGDGVWGLVVSDSLAPPVADAEYVSGCAGCLFADFANAAHNLRFDFGVEPPSFKAIRVLFVTRKNSRMIGCPSIFVSSP